MRPFDPEQRLRRIRCGVHVVGAGMLFVLALLAEMFVHRPLHNLNAACSQRTVELEAAIGDEGKVRAEHAQLAEALAAARHQAAVLRSHIPDKPREADFLGQASNLAGEVGLEIRDYRPGKPVASHNS